MKNILGRFLEKLKIEQPYDLEFLLWGIYLMKTKTRLPCPWDSPGKNTGVGCHFLLQCMKAKSESEVAQSCPTLSDPMDCSPPGSSVHGIFQARVLEWGAIVDKSKRSSYSPFFFFKTWVLVTNISGNLEEKSKTWACVCYKKFQDNPDMHLDFKKWLQVFLFSSAQFIYSVMSDFSRAHGLQHTRLPCPSPTPWAC